jgi:hypothetical protein
MHACSPACAISDGGCIQEAMPQEKGEWQAKAGDKGAEQPVTQPFLARNKPTEPECVFT